MVTSVVMVFDSSISGIMSYWSSIAERSQLGILIPIQFGSIPLEFCIVCGEFPISFPDN